MILLPFSQFAPLPAANNGTLQMWEDNQLNDLMVTGQP
jgi:hypothetical protein